MMMESFLEDAEYSLHHRHNTMEEGSEASGSSGSEDPLDDPFLYDQFLPDPDWSLKDRLEKEEEAKPKNTVDPGPFRYNKRLFVSCMLGVLVILILGGESLVFMVAVGMAITTTIAQLGDSRRCVVIFVLFFIPTHVYVVSTVIPLLWLSSWHVLSVVAINMFVILTAGWAVIQFKAFRTEEPHLAALIELALFTLYPVLSCGLLCWSLASIISPALIPLIFSCLWFVQLQIYLVPTVSSFRGTKKDASGTTVTVGNISGVVEENLDVLQVPMIILIVLAFVWSGPLLQLLVTALSSSPVLTWRILIHLVFMLSLTLFLSSLLSIRQIFEFLGLSFTWLVAARWAGGAVCTLLCYPVLRDYGLDSHFLPLLPVAIGMFAALGVVLSMRKRKVIVAVLGTVLVSSLIGLFLVWIQSMPHHLRHYFLGYLPLNGLYLLMCAHFLLCLLCVATASFDAAPAFGVLMSLQAVALTACEVSLHNKGLYSTSLIQLSSLAALYAIYRLQAGDKISRTAAITASCLHLAKAVAGMSSLVLDKARGEITLLELSALVALMGPFLAVFIYGSSSHKSGLEVLQQLCLLLGGLGVSGHHLLLPVSMGLFQGSHSYSYVLGLWCVMGAALTLLYSQTVTTEFKVQVLKVALTLAVLGLVVIVLHPRLAWNFHSLFQWLEMLDYVTLAAVLSSQTTLSPQHSVVASLPLAVCPAIRMCLMLWSQVWLPQVALLTVTVGAMLVVLLVSLHLSELTQEAETLIKLSILCALVSMVGLVGTDLMAWQSAAYHDPEGGLWALPSWRAVAMLGMGLALPLKVLMAVKGPCQLPVRVTPEGKSKQFSLTLPLVCNGVTIVTFLVACTQGPSEPFLHDLWCCMSAVIMGCLHGDDFFLPPLSGEKQAAPVVLTSALCLVGAAMLRSRLWAFGSLISCLGGAMEVCLLLASVPIHLVLASILWNGKAWSEPTVVFLLPWNCLLFFAGSTYTSWLAGVSGIVAASWMMMTRLPMVPYTYDTLHSS